MTTPRVTVPVEPTEAMIDAWHKATWPQGPRVAPLSQQGLSFARSYRAMLSAAPAPEGGAVSETELRDAIALILPMAKGYAAAHPVGSNQSYVDYVQDLIAAREEV